MRRWLDDIGFAVMLFVIAVTVLFLIAPIVVSIMMSFDGRDYLGKFPPPEYSWHWYGNFFSDTYYIGGLTTMFTSLVNGGCLVVVPERHPDEILAAVERHRVELLPVTPSFINLVLLSEAHTRHDLSSLMVISYGTEPMPQDTLERIGRVLPSVRLRQLYGLPETGVLRSSSRSHPMPTPDHWRLCSLPRCASSTRSNSVTTTPASPIP